MTPSGGESPGQYRTPYIRRDGLRSQIDISTFQHSIRDIRDIRSMCLKNVITKCYDNLDERKFVD
jgi:hypothetical protein